MKYITKFTNFIIRCIIICLLLPQVLPIISYAENVETILEIDGISLKLSTKPYENELGLMVDAGELSDALGLEYTIDAKNKTFSITSEEYGNIVFMHMSTLYYKDGTPIECPPAFYFENAVPMIELGFLCNLLGKEYDIKKDHIVPFSSDTSSQKGHISGKISVADKSALPDNGLDVKLYVTDLMCSVDIYGTHWRSYDTYELSTIHLDESGSADFDFDVLSNPFVVHLDDFFISYKIVDENPYYLSQGYLNNKNSISYLSGWPLYTRAELAPCILNSKKLDLHDSPYVDIIIPDLTAAPMGDLGENAKWSLDIPSGTLTISGSGAINFSDAPPWAELEILVKNIIFEPGITSIEGNLGNPSNLTYVFIPSSIKSISGEAFKGCKSLKEVHTPSIYDWCSIYFDSSLDNPLCYAPYLYCDNQLITSVTIPDGIDRIGPYTFYNYDQLKNITIPDSVSFIGQYAFFDCDSIKNLTIGKGVKEIGSAAFMNCDILNINIIDISAFVNISFGRSPKPNASAWGYETNPLSCAKNIFINGEPVTNVVIPEGTTEIKRGAFYGCKNIKSITLPSSITKIGELAFLDCELDSLYIPSIDSFLNICFEPDQPAWGDDCRSNPLYCANNLYINGVHTTTLVVPEGIKEIKPYTFYDCSCITSIILPNSLTSIDSYAFKGCTGLKSVVIPDSVTSIGGSAFYGCNKLTNIVIPDSVTFIGGSAFYGCNNLTSIEIPGSITSISYDVFSYCNKLTNVIIPDGVQSIDSDAFYGCNNLTNIVIPDSVTSIDRRILEYCDRLENIYYWGDEASWKNISIDADNTALSAVRFLPNGHKAVLFHNNGGSYGPLFMTSRENSTITIPFMIPMRKDFKFKGWADTSTATEPQYYPGSTINVTTSDLNLYALWERGTENSDNTFFTSGTCGENLKWKLYSNGVLEISGTGPMTNYLSNSQPWYNLIDEIKSVVIKNGVTSIGDYAFFNFYKIENVEIPNSVTSISDSAFANCFSLTAINVSSSNMNYSSDENGILFNKYKTQLILFPCKLQMEEYMIPDSVTSIKSDVFDHVKYLNSITVSDNNKYFSSEDGILFNKDKTKIIRYPVARNQSEYLIPHNIISIGDHAFYSCNELTNIVIPDSVTSIGKSAFSICKNLTSIEIPGTVETIGNNAFSSCDSLETVIINDGVKSIGSGAFQDCDSLETVIINDGVKSIGSGAFRDCDSLTSIEIPGTVESIGNDAFISCDSLETVIINDGVKSIGYDAFWDCDSLTSIEIPGTVESIRSDAFRDCDSLETVIINDGVKSIDNYPFADCYNLRTVTIPDSVTSIALGPTKNLTIHGKKDSYAEKYANKNKIKFALLPPDPNVKFIETPFRWYFDFPSKSYMDNATIYVGIYNENNKLLTMKSESLTNVDTTTLFIPKIDNASYGKVFEWTNMNPITSCQTIKLN